MPPCLPLLPQLRLLLLPSTRLCPLHRNVKLTAVDTGALPDCVARDMSLLTISGNTTDASDDAPPPSPEPSSGSSAGSPGLGLLAGALATAAAVAAAAAGRMQLRRRKAARARLWRDAEAEELLGGAPHSATSSDGAAAAAAGARARPSAGGLVCVNRRKRLAALLSDEVQRGRGGAVEMVPMEALPTALAHQLGSSRWRSLPPARPARGSMAAVPEEGAAAVSDALQHEWASMPPAAAVSSGGAGATVHPPASRQWQLPSESLRLQEQELEVSAGRVFLCVRVCAMQE